MFPGQTVQPGGVRPSQRRSEFFLAWQHIARSLQTSPRTNFSPSSGSLNFLFQQQCVCLCACVCACVCRVGVGCFSSTTITSCLVGTDNIHCRNERLICVYNTREGRCLENVLSLLAGKCSTHTYAHFLRKMFILRKERSDPDAPRLSWQRSSWLNSGCHKTK